MARSRVRLSGGPAALLRAVAQEARSGWPPGMTLFTGDDLYHLDRALRLLLDTLVPRETSEFALTIYSEHRIDTSSLATACRSMGMFSDRRVVWVRDVNLIEGDPKPLVELAAAPPRGCYLLIRATEMDRRRKLPQALVSSGRVLEFTAAPDSDPQALSREIAHMAEERDLEIEPSAAILLAEVCAGDFYRIDNELAKLRNWLEGDAPRTVRASLVRDLVAGSGVMSGWEVADAVLQRDRPAALAALEGLLASGEEPLRLLGGLAYRSRGMLQAKGLIEGGASPQQAIAAARLWGGSPQRIAAALARHSIEDLLRFPSLLLAADRTLKSRSISPRAVLESLVDALIPANPVGDRP